MLTRSARILLAVLAFSLVPAVADAQAANARAHAMIRSAMEDYQNLDIDAAMHRLQEALRLCTTNTACSPARTAEVHMAIGTVAVGGQNDSARGVSEFVDALRLDASAIPDPELTTPEITAAFNQAQARAGGGGSTGTATSTGRHGGATGTRPVEPAGPTSGTPPAGGATLLHTPPPEQLQNTPLPVFVDPNGAQATHFTVHYRGLGMTGYASLEMEHVGNGYGGEIPCGQVIEPYVEYYVTATDEGGGVVATVGSPQSPTRVTIVSTRTQPAPFLPGRMPPEQCGEDCPPGMSGPQCHHGAAGGRGERQLGDPCETNNSCAVGLHCHEGACVSGEAAGSGAADLQYRVAFDFGVGVGAAFLPVSSASNPGMPTYAELAHYVDDATMSPTCGPLDASSAETYSCLPTDHISTGFAWTPYLYFAARVRVFERLMLGISVRWQPDSALSDPTMASDGTPLPPVSPTLGTNDNGDSLANHERQKYTLASLFIGGRVYYAVTTAGWARNGFVFAPYIGTGFGQIETRPPVAGDAPPSAHIVSGLNNFHVGAHAEYGVVNFLHFGVDLTFEFMIPTFLFVTDLQATVGLHF